MALATSLRELGLHLAERLEFHRTEIIIPSNGDTAFAKAVYGEPRVIQKWPMLSVQPEEKTRDLREGATRKFEIRFHYNIVLYHGKIEDTLSIQKETHERIEAVEAWFLADFRWNFFDLDDRTLDQVIFGFPAMTDHPIVVAPERELWSASRLELRVLSEEVF